MKIKELLRKEIIKVLKSQKLLYNDKFSIEIPKAKDHGDFSTNVALISAKMNNLNPKVMAEKMLAKFKKNKIVESVSIAGPGFINFIVNSNIYYQSLIDIYTNPDDYGKSDFGQGQKVLLEFVSANPTGPLNIVSARAAAYGDSLYRIMNCAGFQALREFYINDAGNQVEILAESIELRFREILGENIGEMPLEAYHGEYVKSLATTLNAMEGTRILHLSELERIQKIKRFALEEIHNIQLKSLDYFDVEFDSWISEKAIRSQGIIEEVLSYLYEAKCTYEKDEAIWFYSSRYGDEKDRVLLKTDGEPTYIVPDIAYHLTKYQRGFDIMIDVLGPDHHGYIPRLIAALRALNYNEEQLEFVFLQQVNLFNEGEKIKMSKRAGKIITMDELIDEVGKDAARFFFVDRKPTSHLNFDMELAKKQSSENPVYYCQYAVARICSIIDKAKKFDFHPDEFDTSKMKKLNRPDELELIKLLDMFPDIVIAAAEHREPHRLCDYVTDLASKFHKYYHDCSVLNKRTKETTLARLYLITAIKIVIKNCLSLIGVSTPHKMSKKVDKTKVSKEKVEKPKKRK
ncbi:MAG: arginine--tRNA ligase [Candidatus Cloacimonetes bacterium]|jgi:arginyl-tRNA synthetase|nr:arginine--tRNA ligase [Candidatus Cloacimonadota bacterium]